MEQLLLTHWRAPGDVVCATASVRDLALTYPGRYEIHVAGAHPELWTANPYVARVWGSRPPRGMRRCRLSAASALLENERTRLHYITAFHRDLERQLQIRLPTLFPHGDLHLTEAELRDRPVAGRYWLVVAGGKRDMPVKIWPAGRFQEVIDRLRNEHIRFVQAGALLPGHRHPRLNNVVSYVGKADLRGFLRLVYHADGVLCPVSLPMHVAAAFRKPCVVIAGGREPPWWTAYTNTAACQFTGQCAPVSVPHHFLHTIGQLDCCRASGCWKTSVLPDEHVSQSELCQRPVDDVAGQAVPHCLQEISVDRVLAAIRSAASEASSSPQQSTDGP